MKQAIRLLFVFTQIALLMGCFSTADSKNAQIRQDHRKDLSVLYGINSDDVNETERQIERNASLKQWKIQGEVIDKDDPIFALDESEVNRSDVSLVADLVQHYLIVNNYDEDDLWQTVQKFLVLSEFKRITVQRHDGLIKTRFHRRRELVPVEYVRLIARALYARTPVNASGIYDKLIIRIEKAPEHNRYRIYLRNRIMVEKEAEHQSWRLIPFDTMQEVLWLKDLKKFLIGHKIGTLPKLAGVPLLKRDVALKKNKFAGLVYNFDLDVLWSYLISLVDRSNWEVVEVNKVTTSITLKVPKEEWGWVKTLFGSRAALPKVVRLNLNETESGLVELHVEKPIDEPGFLDEEKRQRILTLLNVI